MAMGKVEGTKRAQAGLHPLEEFALSMRALRARECILEAALRTPGGIGAVAGLCRAARSPNGRAPGADDEAPTTPSSLRQRYLARLERLQAADPEPASFVPRHIPLPGTRMAAMRVGRTIELTDDEARILAGHVRNACSVAETEGCGASGVAADLAATVHRAECELSAIRNTVVQRNLKLLWHVAPQWQHRGLDVEDLLQAGSTGLIRAAEKFDWGKCARFSTYAVHWINQAMERAVQNDGRCIRLPVHLFPTLAKVRRLLRELPDGEMPDALQFASTLKEPVARVRRALEHLQPVLSLDAPAGEKGDSTIGAHLPAREELPPVTVARNEEAAIILAEVRKLPPREAWVVCKRFGMDGEREHTLEEVGDELERTRERVRQIEKKALEKLSKRLPLTGIEGLPSVAAPTRRIHVRARKAS